MLQDRHYSRPSSRFYGHFRYTVMLFSSFPVWRAIRINVMGIRRRYVNLTVVNVLVSFKFELWLGYHVNLVKTHYYNSFFLHQKVRMVTSILSWKIVESLGDISKSFAIWSPEVSTRFALSTIFLLYVLELKRILISVTPSAFNILSFPKRGCMRSMLVFTSRSAFKDSKIIYFMVGSHGIISVQSSFNP